MSGAKTHGSFVLCSFVLLFTCFPLNMSSNRSASIPYNFLREGNLSVAATAGMNAGYMTSDFSDLKPCHWTLEDLQFYKVIQIRQSIEQFFGGLLPEPQFDGKSLWTELLTAENAESATDTDVQKLLTLIDTIEENGEEGQVDLVSSKLLSAMGIENKRRIVCLRPSLPLIVGQEESWTTPHVALMDSRRRNSHPLLLQENRRAKWMISPKKSERLHPIPQVVAQAIAAYQCYGLDPALVSPKIMVRSLLLLFVCLNVI
jgi:hypothetical protein